MGIRTELVSIQGQNGVAAIKVERQTYRDDRVDHNLLVTNNGYQYMGVQLNKGSAQAVIVALNDAFDLGLDLPDGFARHFTGRYAPKDIREGLNP